MMPATVAPVQRETAATVSRDGGAIAAAMVPVTGPGYPCAGDDAE